MTPDYEVYKGYDPKATMKINPQRYSDWVHRRIEIMLEAMKRQRPDTYDRFLDQFSYHLGEVVADSESKTLSAIVTLEKILPELPRLNENRVLSERISRFLMEQLRLQETYSEETGKAIVPYVNYERARNLLQYNLLKALADVLGRDSAIQAYREIVEYLARELAKREPVTLTFPQLRESMIHHSSTDGGFTFAIAHLDESMFLAKFDRCVIYESLRDVDDPELGYYATCYTGLIITNHQLNNLRMRRTQTLFTGSFCDELRWDPSVHDEPKQPPLKYSRSLIIE